MPTLYQKLGTTVIAAVLLLSPLAYAEKLAINKNGIKVWTYQVSGNPMLQYRAETILNTSLENAVGLILDTERSKKLVPNVGDIQVIERDDKAGKFIFYMTLDFPFPLSDRDLIVEGNLSRSGNKVVFRNQSIVDARAPNAGKHIRITNYKGDWTFQKIDANHVKVSTSGFADPAGAIPISFVNSFVQQQPYSMLQLMKKQVTQTNYTLKDLPSILH